MDLDIDVIKQKRASHLGRLLWDLSRDFHQQSLEHIRSQTPVKVKNSYYDLFPYMDTSGTDTAELIKRSGLSKQAIARTLSEMEADGLIQRRTSVEDARAKTVHFTEKGLSVLAAALTSVMHTVTVYENILGEDAEVLKELLLRLAEGRQLKRKHV